MAIVITPENISGDRRTLSLPVHIHQDDGVTPLPFATAYSEMNAYAAANYNVPARWWTVRQLSAFSWRFDLEYSTHTFQQDDPDPDNEVLTFPRLLLPEPRKLIYPLERLRGSTGASGSNPEARFLEPSNAGVTDGKYTSVRVEPPKQNQTFTVDIPTEAKYNAFLAALKKCHGKLNDDTFQGNPAGCVMILTAAAVSPPGEIPRIDIGAAVGEKYDLTLDTETLEDVLPFSWLGLKLDGVTYGIVGPAEATSAVNDNTVTGINELRVFDEADYSALDLPEPTP